MLGLCRKDKDFELCSKGNWRPLSTGLTWDVYIRTKLLCVCSVKDGWDQGTRFHARKPVMVMFE